MPNDILFDESESRLLLLGKGDICVGTYFSPPPDTGTGLCGGPLDDTGVGHPYQ